MAKIIGYLIYIRRSLLFSFLAFCFFVIFLTVLSGNNFIDIFYNYFEKSNYLFLTVSFFYNFILLCVLFFLVRHIYFFSFLFSFFVFSNYLSYKTFGSILTFDVVSISLSEIGRANDFFDSYFSFELFFPLLGFLVASFFLKKIADLNIGYFKISNKLTIFISICLLFLSLCSGYFFEARTKGSFNFYIDPFRTISKIIYTVNNGVNYKKRMDLNEFPENKSAVKNILLIIDESIAYGHLSINGYDRATTPYLASIKNEYYSMGKSLSSFNCSASSNFVLTTGIRPQDIPDPHGLHTLSQPSLFSFAKKSGFKTAYFSAQTPEGKFQNYMSKYDLEQIDFFYSNNLESSFNDYNMIEAWGRFITENENTFSIMVKQGAHFPWKSNKYEGRPFEAVLPDGEPLSLSRKSEAINSYDNLIVWGVDKFMEKLIPMLSKEKDFVIYTSDHGQNIFDNEQVSATHCTFSGIVPPEQGYVPILIFGSNEVKVSSGAGFYSHFNIVPTIKHVMGFKVDMNDTFFSDTPQKYDYFFSGGVFDTAHKVYVPQ